MRFDVVLTEDAERDLEDLYLYPVLTPPPSAR